MKKLFFRFSLSAIAFFFLQLSVQTQAAKKPVIFADVPDASMIPVGGTYYMSSTTMHMRPGVPIMKSKILVSWKLTG